jgi:hypothetical protein
MGMKKVSLTSLLAPLCAMIASCVPVFQAAASTVIVVSVPDQKQALVRDGQRVAGLGDRPSSYATPLGKLEVAERIGGGLPLGAVLKGRQPTGEVLSVNAAGRDPIVTRILYLRGLEACNQNAHGRAIYIHGTPVESALGKPASYGCVRMRSKDVAALFDAVPVGATVEILNESMRRMLPASLAATKLSVPPVNAAAENPANKQERALMAAARTAATASKPMAKTSPGTQSSTIKTGSLTSASSLGGIENLQASRQRDLQAGAGRQGAQNGHGGIGLSMSLW